MLLSTKAILDWHKASHVTERGNEGKEKEQGIDQVKLVEAGVIPYIGPQFVYSKPPHDNKQQRNSVGHPQQALRILISVTKGNAPSRD